MKINKKFGRLATQTAIDKTIKTLKTNGFDAIVVKNGSEAREKVLKILPQGAEIMMMTSQTGETIGLYKEIEDSGRYDLVREKLEKVGEKEKRHLGAAPDWVVGSVHAVTEDGSVLIASNTGSQLPAYVYGATRVIWVIGAQKIVKNREEGIKRIYEYSFPLEDVRAQKAYGIRSGVNNILIVNKVNPFTKGRITLILVKEKLGF